MTRNNLAVNILAKSYASECLKMLHIATKHLCPGCINKKFEQRYHVICLSSVSDKIFYCCELLCDMFDERAVSDNIQFFMAQLGMSISSLSEQLFNVEERRKLLDSASFWDCICSYAIPWANLPTYSRET